jgi:hypothetical protein
MSQEVPQNPRTKDFVASSAAALVSEWAYRSTPTKTSTDKNQENKEITQGIDMIEENSSSE